MSSSAVSAAGLSEVPLYHRRTREARVNIAVNATCCIDKAIGDQEVTGVVRVS